MKRQILFRHIPKTGGTTLRIIFNRVYGEEKVYHIKSTDVGSSYWEFRKMSAHERKSFRVISGHGAEMFAEFVNDPFVVSVLREPVPLFFSQYRFLKTSTPSLYYDEVKKLRSPDEYLEYAISKGQDNLLTRYFSNSMRFLIDHSTSIPNMEKEGPALLEVARQNLHTCDALLDLSGFDSGVFALSKMLNWKGIPVYRPSNITRGNRGLAQYDANILQKLKHFLRWDIELYNYFRQEKLDIALLNANKQGLGNFLLKQKMIRIIARAIGKQ